MTTYYQTAKELAEDWARGLEACGEDPRDYDLTQMAYDYSHWQERMGLVSDLEGQEWWDCLPAYQVCHVWASVLACQAPAMGHSASPQYPGSDLRIWHTHQALTSQEHLMALPLEVDLDLFATYQGPALEDVQEATSSVAALVDVARAMGFKLGFGLACPWCI